MDLTHPDVAPETLTAVGEAAGVPYPETEAAAAQRRKLIHAAVENALLALIRSRWPRPEEVTLRKIPPAGGLAGNSPPPCFTGRKVDGDGAFPL